MNRDVNRREFLALSTGLLAAAGAPLGQAVAAPVSTCRSVVFITLRGGVAQTDFWDPKEFTPFRRGMRGCDLLCTCDSIPTAADSVRFGAGLEELAALMDRGAVIRSVDSRGAGSTNHHNAVGVLYDGLAAVSGSPGPSLARRGIRELEPDAACFLSGVADRADGQFANELCRALRRVDAGDRVIRVDFPYVPRGLFDAHENGAIASCGMKRRIDGPVARFILALESRGLLRQTLVVIVSEFGRTVGAARRFGSADDAAERTGERLVLRAEREYGFHGHFSAAHSVLLFGGPVNAGNVIGMTSPVHPMVVTRDPVSFADLFATISFVIGVPSASRAGRVIPGALRLGAASTVHS